MGQMSGFDETVYAGGEIECCSFCKKTFKVGDLIYNIYVNKGLELHASYCSKEHAELGEEKEMADSWFPGEKKVIPSVKTIGINTLTDIKNFPIPEKDGIDDEEDWICGCTWKNPHFIKNCLVCNTKRGQPVFK